MNKYPKRGEIWLVNWNPARGSEQAGQRPALIIQNDIGNKNERRINIMNDIGIAEKPINIVEDIDNTIDTIGKQAKETYERLLDLNTIVLGTNPLLDNIKEDRPELKGYIQLHLQKLRDISGQLVDVSKLLKPLEEQFLKSK